MHGSSSSGAACTQPLSTVEINNDIVALEQQEAESRRVLLGLTDQYRRRALDLQRTIESATDLDVIQAKARLSAIVGGAEPALSTDGAFELLAARHPLLIPAGADRLAARPSAAGEGGAGSDAASGRPVWRARCRWTSSSSGRASCRHGPEHRRQDRRAQTAGSWR